MKIAPNLFASATPPSQPSQNATQARLAFEAMLSAGAARTVSTPQPSAVQPRPAPPTQTQGQASVEQSDEQPVIARPGRVLDIRA